MKRILTPLNVLAILLIIYAIYTIFSDQPVGDGLTKFWVLPAVGLALLFLLIDFILQKKVTKYISIILIELAIPCVILLIPRMYGYINRANTLHLTAASGKPYCVIIYDVKNADEAFIKGHRDVPVSAVLFSPEKLDGNLREVYLTGEHIIGHSYFDDQLRCAEKTYNYRAWFLVADRNNNYEEDSLKLEIKQYLQSQCEAIAKLK